MIVIGLQSVHSSYVLHTKVQEAKTGSYIGQRRRSVNKWNKNFSEEK